MTARMRSVLVSISGSRRLNRPGALRLALAARRAWRDCVRELPADVDVEIDSTCRVASARLSGDKLTWRLPEQSACRGADEQKTLFSKALVSMRPAKRAAKRRLPRAQFPGKPKALFFRNLLNSADKELKSESMYQGVFYIASALKRAGIACVLAEGRISLSAGEIVTDPNALARVLSENPDINFIGLTLFDAYFEKAAELIKYLRVNTRAFIAVGGYMPTDHPYETMAHLPGAHFIVRGAADEIVPKLLSIIGGANTETGLDRSRIEALRGLEGILFGQEQALLLASDDQILRVHPNKMHLDFSILEARHVRSGTNLFVSRGCPYHCLFCTSKDKGRFEAKSPARVARLLADYGRRLKQIYGSFAAVPQKAFAIGFYDDDFLSDAAWAAEIFGLIRRSPFHLRFFQASISSFYKRHGAAPLELDRGLLDAMPADLFTPKQGSAQSDHPHVYIGTENYNDDELARLGKNHRYAAIEMLVKELSSRGIRQAHHFIISNVQTTLGDVLDNVEKIADLERRFSPAFTVLKPPIAQVVSFYDSPQYKLMKLKGFLGQIELRSRLSVPGFAEFDYPLASHDLAFDGRARELSTLIPSWCQEGNWEHVRRKAFAYAQTHEREGVTRPRVSGHA